MQKKFHGDLDYLQMCHTTFNNTDKFVRMPKYIVLYFRPIYL